MASKNSKRNRVSSSQDSSKIIHIDSPAESPISRPHESLQLPHLSRLPHEILLSIVTPILADDYVLVLHSKRRFERKSSTAMKSPHSPLLSVLLTCRSLYFAGAEAFYKGNTFSFHNSEHLRKFMSGLGYDQRWWIRDIELYVEWVRSRNAGRWYLLHDMDYCSGWKDAIDRLPNLRTIVIRSVTKYGQRDLFDSDGRGLFERRMREEMGSDKEGMLKFKWLGAQYE